MTKNKMQKYTDKYFLRANEVLKAEGLNPWVNMQVFVRKGPGKAAGIDEAIELITDNSNIENVDGRIYAKKEGSLYEPSETQMNIIAPIQEIMELETVYLGAISKAITNLNDKKDIDLNNIYHNASQVINLAGGRPVFYFGARHWHYDSDKNISKICFDAGVSDCSTDNGAEQVGKKGVGTVPHASENVNAFYHGLENAVAKSTEAFDKYMDPKIPRIALVDYANREITDTIDTINALRGDEQGTTRSTKLDGVRIDTCGENVSEGGLDTKGKNYWTGPGVTVMGVYALRKAIDEMKLDTPVKIVLSSGFSNPNKVKAFNQAEKYFGMKLYDAIGAGFLDNVRTATADIIAVGNSPDELDFYTGKGVEERNIIHKVGRPPKPNYDLKRIF